MRGLDGRFPRELKENGVRYLEDEEENGLSQALSQARAKVNAREKNKERGIGGGRNRWMDTDIIHRGDLI